MRLRKVVLTGILAVLAGTAIPARAATSISTCNPAAAAPAGSLITAPGNYVVTADLNCTGLGDDNGIDIYASNVSVNLNGHIINGCPVAACSTAPLGTGINVAALAPNSRLNHVGISGPGEIRGFVEGITIQDANYVQVSLTTVAGNLYGGIYAADVTGLTVAGNVIAQNGVFGGLLLVDSAGAQVTGNQVVANTTGIVLGSGDSNTLTGNVVSGNSGSGIVLGVVSSMFPLTNSRVSSNTTNGNGTSGPGSGIQVVSLVVGSSGNEIFSNLSSVGNKTWDLEDDNAPPPCGTDFWSGNSFFTRSPASCVK